MIKFSDRELLYVKKCKHIIGRTDWDRRVSSILAPQSKYYHCDEIMGEIFYQNTWAPVPDQRKIKIYTTNANSYFKGFETIIATIQILTELEVDFEWTVAGISESDLIYKVVKRQLGKKFCTKGLKLLGRVSAVEISKQLINSDIYVMPSHIENSPNNLSEAMLSGVPCIATYVGGTGSILRDGIDGILIQDGDPWAMAGAILELKRDPVKMIEFSKNSMIAAKRRYNKKRIIQSLLSVYDDVIKSELDQ